MAGRFLLLILASAGIAQAQGNSVCAHWCKANFAEPGAVCTSLAAKGKGPCYQCGPLKTSPSQQLCGGACTDTSTDNANCGSCGNVCPADSTCTAGVCKSNLCTNPFSCGGAPTYCGNGVPGSLCVCFSRGGDVAGQPTACLDVTQLGGCPPTQCTDDVSCGSGKACVSSCCGKTCAVLSATAACANPSNPTRLFRRDQAADILATSPYLNPPSAS